MTMGMTNGNSNCGMFAGSTNWDFGCTSDAYGKTLPSSNSNGLIKSCNWGLTTDSTKSGIETDISSNIKYIIKY